jgi:TM2 domain-containing membrane protein YozV
MEIIDENGHIVPKSSEESKRVIAGILGILLGAFGVHKFVLGYTNQGIVMLVITIVTCGIGGGITGLIGLIEGIIYLTKTDEEFVYMYQINKKEWF